MRTRTLLLLAIAVGLVILVAGSIKLFLIADDEAPANLSVGQSEAIGDMTVTVVAVDRIAADILIRVRLVGVDDADGATSWVFGVVGEQLRPSAAPESTGPPCGPTVAAEPVECVLAFHTDESRGVLIYARAGEQRRWDIVAPG
ncbi:MAG: hypothetical protein ABIW84_03240 [Ilumatobacteraceae bacterium]